MFQRVLFHIFLACQFAIPLTAEADPTIEWEITNRFSPFVTQDNAKDLFKTYRFQEGQSFEEWHKNFSENIGVSPYYAALSSGASQNMHWDQEERAHSEDILKYVKHEDDPETTVEVSVWFDMDGECSWSIGEKNVGPVPCRDEEEVEFVIPLTGSDVTVAYEGGSVTKFLEPQHIVIVAMGDSYAAGEGNPDYPGEWKSNTPLPDEGEFAWLAKKGYLESPREGVNAPTKHWIDDTCHRSFFSHQSLTALKMASDKPRAFVSFLHYACTGAEIFDGLLVPQYQPKGKAPEDQYVSYSQLNFAINELCRDEVIKYVPVSSSEIGGLNLRDFHRRGGEGNSPKTASLLTPNMDAFSKETAKLRSTGALPDDHAGLFPQSGILHCPPEQIRKPDYLFVNIGGNDIGFADIVKYFLVPSEWKTKKIGEELFPEVCPRIGNRVDAEKFSFLDNYCEQLDVQLQYHAGDLISGGGNNLGMEDRLNFLFNVLETRLSVNSSDIVMPQYPDPIRDKPAQEPVCDALEIDPSEFIHLHGDAAGVYHTDSQWDGLKAAAGPIVASIPFLGRNMQTWQFNFTSEDAGLALRQFDEFRTVLSKAARNRGVTFVCGTRDAFVGYGWWKGSRTNLPNSAPKWDPSTWKPYAYETETRAIRTGNDSVLTQPGDKRIAGAIHPNLTGHRMIAEMVYETILERVPPEK
nr:hypothetical protein [uncultured Celeribacter sp.]